MEIIKFEKEELSQALQPVLSVVERRNALPILLNVLINFHQNRVSFTTSDIEIQITSILLNKNNNLENFKYALALGEWLAIQYTYRYKKVHKSQRIIDHIRFHKLKNVVKNFTKVEFTPPPQCMPDKYKHKDYITAYRNYYKGAKRYFAKWDKLNNKPDWWTE